MEGEEDRVSQSEKRHAKGPKRGPKGIRRLRSVEVRADTPTVHSWVAPNSFAAEQYLNLAVRIEERVAAREGPAFLLSVSSPEPASGKTLTSLNLALTLGRICEGRVLLVECDLRRPSLFQYLEGEGPVPGLADILVDDVEFGEAVATVKGTRLDLLGAGTVGKMENLIADNRMVEEIGQLGSLYEIVIFDSPPLPMATGRSLANMAQGVLLVVRAGQTRKRDIEDALSALEPGKVVGMVLNGVRQSRLGSSAYSSYAYYDRDQASTIDGEETTRRAGEGVEPFPRDFSMNDGTEPGEGT